MGSATDYENICHEGMVRFKGADRSGIVFK